MFRKPALPVLGLAVTIAFAAFGTAVQGEISKRGEASTKKTAAIASAPKLAPDTPLRVECWQDGQKIITEDGLYGFTLNSLLDGTSVTFRRAPRGNADLFIVSLKHSTCIIRHAPGGDAD